MTTPDMIKTLPDRTRISLGSTREQRSFLTAARRAGRMAHTKKLFYGWVGWCDGRYRRRNVGRQAI